MVTIIVATFKIVFLNNKNRYDILIVLESEDLKMEYRLLGNTNLKVSAVALGCEGFEGKNLEETKNLIDKAFSEGMNFIDIYSSNPELRANLGIALSSYKRDQFVIHGHIGSAWQNGQYKRTRNLEECKQAFDEFRKLMQIDYVDIGCIHYCDDEDDFDDIINNGVLDYALSLKNQGVIKALSISTHSVDIAKKVTRMGIFDVMLFSLNPAYDMVSSQEGVDIFFESNAFNNRQYQGIDPSREELYKLAEANGVSIIVMKGYAGGLLLDKKQTPFADALTPAQCLNYCLTRPAVKAVMVGVHSESEIVAACYYNEATPTERDYSLVLAQTPNSTFIGHCMYCGHCAPCTAEIDIAMVNKLLDLALTEGEVVETIREHYASLKHHASECVECKKCMKNCPFGVDVVSKMHQAQKTFGN